ncbi:hypothetical protein VTI74DRAFT_8477 [Chaetomium olivicolor]
MEGVETAEAFVDKDGDLAFDHTKIILRRNEDGADDVELTEIPADNVWPVFDPASKLSRAPQPLPTKAYVKRQSLLDFGDTPAPGRLGEQVLTEAEICDLLIKHPVLGVPCWRPDNRPVLCTL